MTKEEIAKRVAEIRSIGKDDPEVAHAKEDALFVELLTHIASDAYDASALAEAALKTRAIKFPRWYA
jgi:hypothetical protein